MARQLNLCIKDGEQPEPLEIMEREILAISVGMKRLRSTRLNDKALFLLIQNAAPHAYGKAITIKQIESVFEGIESLEKKYLKKSI